MKIWTCGSFQRIGSWNAWTRIKNFKGASRLSNIWNFFGTTQIISYRARLVTMDETWLYHYDPEKKQQSMEWRQRGSTRPKILRVQKSAGKFLTSIFWNLEGILLIYYLPKGQNIKADYYWSLLLQFKDILNEKAARSSPRGSCSCTTPAHRTLATDKKLAYLQFQFLYHPHNSPDLFPSEYHLFPQLRNQLEGYNFSSDAEVIAVAETWLDGKYFEYFLSGLQKLEQRTKKFIELRGEYVE